MYFFIGALLLRTEQIQRLYIFPGWSIKYGKDDNSRFSIEPPIVFQSQKKIFEIIKDNNNLTIIKNNVISKDSIISINDDKGKSLFNVKLKNKISPPPSKYNSSSEKIFVVSDIEGNFSFFERLLKSNRIIDDNFNWIFGKNHLVLLGDYFDRGTQVFESLWLIYKLEDDAEKQGGKVHFILGNHDIMNLEGDYRYVRIFITGVSVVTERYVAITRFKLFNIPDSTWTVADSDWCEIKLDGTLASLGFVDNASTQTGMDACLISESFNIDTVYKTGAGRYRIKFKNALPKIPFNVMTDSRQEYDPNSDCAYSSRVDRKVVPNDEYVDINHGFYTTANKFMNLKQGFMIVK